MFFLHSLQFLWDHVLDCKYVYYLHRISLMWNLVLLCKIKDLHSTIDAYGRQTFEHKIQQLTLVKAVSPILQLVLLHINACSKIPDPSIGYITVDDLSTRYPVFNILLHIPYWSLIFWWLISERRTMKISSYIPKDSCISGFMNNTVLIRNKCWNRYLPPIVSIHT